MIVVNSETENTESRSTDEGPFNDRILEFEVNWLARSLTRVLGAAIFLNDEIDETDDEDPTVQHHKAFDFISSDMVKSMDLSGGKSPARYREQFGEPDEEMWKTEVAEQVKTMLSDARRAGWDIDADIFDDVTGVVMLPADAAEEFGYDYSSSNTPEVYLPLIGGEPYDPVDTIPNFDETETEPEPEPEEDAETEQESLPPWEQPAEPEPEEDTPSPEPSGTQQPDETELTGMEKYIDFDSLTVREGVNLNDLDRQEAAVVLKVEAPSRTYQEIVDQMKSMGMSYSTSSVSNSLKKHIDEDQRERLKQMGREEKKDSESSVAVIGESVANSLSQPSDSETDGDSDQSGATEETVENTPSQPSSTQQPEESEDTEVVEAETVSTQIPEDSLMSDLIESMNRKEGAISVHRTLIGSTSRLAKEGDGDAIVTLYRALMELDENGDN